MTARSMAVLERTSEDSRAPKVREEESSPGRPAHKPWASPVASSQPTNWSSDGVQLPGARCQLPKGTRLYGVQ